MDLREKLQQCIDSRTLTKDEMRKYIDDWFLTPNTRLGNKTPQYCIEHGEYDEVRDIVEEMYSNHEFK